MNLKFKPAIYRSSTLAALTSSALILPGYTTQAIADVAPDRGNFSYRYSHYKEDSLPTSKIMAGSNERYTIDVHQLRFFTPVTEKYSISVDYQTESMSGASPWSVSNDSNGETKVIMSGASINERRDDVSISVTQYRDTGQSSAALIYSEENDYQSKAISLSNQQAFNNDHTRLTTSLSHADDKIEPTQGPHNNFDSGDKKTTSVFVGGSQIINASTLIHAGIGYTHASGDLNDAYKLGDQRPDSRNLRTLSIGVKKNLEKIDSTVSLDYRYYTDDWEIRSHTFDLLWHYRATQRWQLIPSVRYYTQDQAEFYKNQSITPGPKNSSNDFRLSTFEAFTYGLEMRYALTDFTIVARANEYSSKAGGLFDSTHRDHSLGLVDFTLYTIGFDYSFDL